jgi:putative DNA-invertase from lambdoid prophage Rac
MFRSALDALGVLGRLKRGGISLHMIDLGGDTTGNGVSKLIFTILSAVAEAERERIAQVKKGPARAGAIPGRGSHPSVDVSARPASWCPSPNNRRR